jgi:hypothetical protein
MPWHRHPAAIASLVPAPPAVDESKTLASKKPVKSLKRNFERFCFAHKVLQSMNIHELDSYNLGDAVKFNNKLNPRIWGADEKCVPKCVSNYYNCRRF